MSDQRISQNRLPALSRLECPALLLIDRGGWLFRNVYFKPNLSVSGWHGLILSPIEIAGLSKVGVKCLKDTSGNAPGFTELVFGLSDQITAFNGWDTLTFYGLAAGSPGAVWGAANIIPELAVELYEAVTVKGDLKRGRELWIKAWPICKFLESHNYAAAVKTGVELTGQSTGGLRKPFALLRPELQDELKALLKNAGLKTI
ncbi:hypothetical protein BDW59DRAFT_163112 [Aspergillus cavernicola]|uniref:Dihydrodipicolinate synthetase family protein n=1 Tax=Aspergillus cavernicola TaxID=176166 RepID=A0ABR4I719_9EURO